MKYRALPFGKDVAAGPGSLDTWVTSRSHQHHAACHHQRGHPATAGGPAYRVLLRRPGLFSRHSQMQESVLI
jgi:hypothetical protein